MDDNKNMVYIKNCQIPIDKAIMIEAIPAVTLQFLRDLRRGTGILCLCKKTSIYYESKIEKITGDGDDKIFTVHFKNYSKKQQQNFSLVEARYCFLQHTTQIMKYVKKYNEIMPSIFREISVQEREVCVDDPEDADEGDNEGAPSTQQKSIPEISDEHCESLKILANIDNGRLMTRYPPRYCIEQLLKEFDASTKMFSFFSEITLNSFCSDFESSYMFTNQHFQADYEKDAALSYYMKNLRIRNLPPITREEIDIKLKLFGQWKAEINVRYVYGVVQLIRYIKYLYSELYQIEQERTLEEKEDEILLLVTNLAHFIYQNREKYFCEEKDYTQPMDES